MPLHGNKGLVIGNANEQSIDWLCGRVPPRRSGACNYLSQRQSGAICAVFG